MISIFEGFMEIGGKLRFRVDFNNENKTFPLASRYLGKKSTTQV